MCSCQDPTHGWCPRPKVRFPRAVTATAARTTAPAAACLFTAATRLCPPTNTASSTTSTATMSTPARGKLTHNLPSRFIMLLLLDCPGHTCRVHMFQVHPERERISTLLALGCTPQRHSALLRRQHTQRHVTQQWGQVFLC